MFNYVFYMPSSLHLLHTAMPITPCLNAFWHSDPYIFLEMFFYLAPVNFFGSLIFSEDKQLHAAAANRELR